MSKTLRTAALVVGAAALVVATAGALAPVATAGVLGSIGITASAAAVAAGLSAASAGLSFAAQATMKKPGVTISGNQTSFTASLDQGIPWVIGRTATAGCCVHDITFDANASKNNTFQTFFGVWSGDRINRLVRTTIDTAEVTFALNPVAPSVPDEAVGSYHNWMWRRYQLGLSPEPEALIATGFAPHPAGWGADAKLSGMAAFSWTLKFDEKGKAYPGGVVPKKLDELEGALAWDPRLDSTFPGGDGPQRADDESTWGWTENPFLLGLKWARGIWQNGKRVMGIGMALAAIDVPSAVYAANVADANGWKVGGVVYSTDPKWDVLLKICAAGSGEPIKVGGKLHFICDTPRVSLATIRNDDIVGRATVPGGTRAKDRINGCIPTFRSPDNGWQLVPAAKVTVPAYVATDRRARTKAVTWELCQSAAQVAQLATYEICNRREIDGIIMPLKLKWIGYKPGDAITVAASVVAMDNQLVVLRRRTLDPGTATVTFTARTETAEKHPFALGKTTTPPPTPALATTDRTGLLMPGVDAAWTSVRDDDPVNHPKPADGADVTADVFASLDQGRSPQQVIDDLDTSQLNVLAQATKLGQYQFATDQLLYNAKGEPIGVTLAALGTIVDGHNTVYAQLVRTDDGLFRVISTINSDGVITGTENLIDQDRKSQYLVYADIFGVVQRGPDGTPIKPFVIVDGVAYFDHVKVRQLDDDTAAVSGGADSTNAVAGAYTPADGTASPRSAVLTTSVTMKAPGWIKATFDFRQGFSQNAPYFASIAVDGVEIPNSYRDGFGAQDNVSSTMRFYAAEARTYVIQAMWAGHTSITLMSRTLDVTGLPFTRG